MIKFFGAFRHLSALSNAQAYDHYLTSHAAAVLKAPEFVRNQLRYVQHWAVQDAPSLPAALKNPFMDGTAETWYDSVEVMTETFASAGYMEFIRPDEEKFIDVSKVIAVVAREDIKLAGQTLPPFKLFTFLVRKANASTVDAQAFWRDVFAPALRKDRAAADRMIGHIQNYAVRNTTLPFELEVDYEGVDEVWLSSIADSAPYLEAEQRVAKETGADKFFDWNETVRFLTMPREVPGFRQSK